MTNQFLWEEIQSTWLAKMHFFLLGDLPFLLVPRFQGSITRALPQMGVVWISKVNESNKTIWIFFFAAHSQVFPFFSCYHVYEINIYMFIYLVSFNEIYLINILDIVRTPTHQTPSPPEHFLGDFNQSVGPWAQ